MIRGYAPPTSANSYGLCLRRRAKKSRLRLFFFARQPALPYGNTAAADFRAICIRIRSPRQSGTSQRRASTGCAFGAEQKRAACGSFSLRGGPPHTRRNTSSAETSSAPSPTGEGKGSLLLSCSVQSFGCFGGFAGIVFRQSNQAFPSGGRGTASAVDEVFTHCGNGSSWDACVPYSSPPREA